MPLVKHSSLPTFERLREQGHDLLSMDRAVHQDIRELHIGFLNMMPDAALQATERQFIRLIGSCNCIAQFYVYPFTLPELGRSVATQAYVREHYSEFSSLKAAGLDALIITGANVASADLSREPFWEPLLDVARWAEGNVASILCSCLATHALLKQFHNIDRQPLPTKRWGVFSHRVVTPEHPLCREINSRFDAPHSRHNDISRTALEAAGLRVLAESDSGGVHLATSPDQIRVVYFQGHPEYDRNSLLKEYKREWQRYFSGARGACPPFPENYFSAQVQAALKDCGQDERAVMAYLENTVEAQLDNTWGDTAKAIVNNWLGMVYQLTNLDRSKQFMDHVDPANPLGLDTI